MITYNQLIRKGRIKKIRCNRRAALQNCPQQKGVCTKVYFTKPKKPNSAIRKIAKIKLFNKKKIIAYIPGEGHNLQEHSIVLIRGGRTQDLPGLKFKIIRGKYDAVAVLERKNARSKYGMRDPKKIK